MNVYFTASVAAKDKLLNEYMSIINYLITKGHKVQHDHITKATQEEIRSLQKKDILAFQSKDESWIKDCDFMIADTTHPSVSVGYEISLALRMGKPVLLFYGKDGPPSLLSIYKGEILATERYDEETYKETIDEFIKFADSKSDFRFTFFISPAIALFLEEVAQEERVPKSVYIRKLIETDMKKRRSL